MKRFYHRWYDGVCKHCGSVRGLAPRNCVEKETLDRKADSKGKMTVAEAGRKGGLKVRDERGHEFYEEIGRKGGMKLRQLVEAGKRAVSRSR